MSNLTSITLSSGNVTNTGTFSTLDNSFGTAGTSNANVASVQGISGGTPVSVSGPVSVIGTSNVSVVNGVTTVAVSGTANVSVVNGITTVAVSGTSNVSVVNGITTVGVSGTVTVAGTVTTSAPIASDFLWYAGYSSNNGLVTSTVTLLSGELEGLTAGGVIVSSSGGNSGVFSNSNTGQATVGEIFYYDGTVGIVTPGSGANIAIWFLQTPDGVAYESTTVAPPRPPDAIIPLSATTIAATTFVKGVGPVNIPALTFKVLAQNNAASTISITGSGAYIKLAPLAVAH